MLDTMGQTYLAAHTFNPSDLESEVGSRSLGVQNMLGVHGEFRASQGYIVRPRHIKQNKPANKRFIDACYHSTGKAEPGRSPGFSDQPASPTWWVLSQQETLSYTKVDNGWGMTWNTFFWPHLLCTHVCTLPQHTWIKPAGKCWFKNLCRLINFRSSEEVIRSPGTGVKDIYEAPYECWESNLVPLEEQPELLTTKLSLCSLKLMTIHVITKRQLHKAPWSHPRLSKWQQQEDPRPGREYLGF